MKRKLLLSVIAAVTAVVTFWGGLHHAEAQQQQKPNILFIMGDDIGWMQPSIYHQGLMVGETPNIDKIGQEGAKFTEYYAEQSCTAGRNAFFTGMHPLRTGMIPPGCDARGELPRHQQNANAADGRATVQEHADPRRARGARCG
jgi:arylsulfatase